MPVNDFTKFTVMENFTKKFCFMVKKLVSDGLFGSTTTWEDGMEFLAIERHDQTIEAQQAEQQGTASTYSLYVDKDIKLPLIRKADEIRAAIGDWLTIECEGGAILLCAGNPWAQPMGNPPEKYLCTYLIFDVTSFVV